MKHDYLDKLFGLSGQTAIVVGGTGVLGGALADGLAAAGAFVVVAGRNGGRGVRPPALLRWESSRGAGRFKKAVPAGVKREAVPGVHELVNSRGVDALAHAGLRRLPDVLQRHIVGL